MSIQGPQASIREATLISLSIVETDQVVGADPKVKELGGTHRVESVRHAQRAEFFSLRIYNAQCSRRVWGHASLNSDHMRVLLRLPETTIITQNV